MKKRMLYISFYFPPAGAIASIRALKMVKYLMPCQAAISVVCADSRYLKAPQDAELCGQIPPKAEVLPALYPDPAWLYKILYGLRLGKLVMWLDRRLLRPGSEIIWLPFAKRKIDKVMSRQKKPELAVISFGPPAVLKMALYLKQRYDLPYVLDWRDEYTNNPELINSPSLPMPGASERELERKALANASACVYLSSIMRDNFHSAHPFLKSTPHRIIPNGFDEEDFASLKPQHHNGKTMQILYSGSFYDRRQPNQLWAALDELISEGSLKEGQLSFTIRGNNRLSFVLGSYQDKAHIRSMTQLLPYLSYRQNLREMMAADALLLYIPSGKNTQSVLTGKIFEYLRASKPVLAIIPPHGEAAAILGQAGIGYIAQDTDLAGIKSQILRLYQDWQSGITNQLHAPPELLAEYSRQKQAMILLELINSL